MAMLSNQRVYTSLESHLDLSSLLHWIDSFLVPSRGWYPRVNIQQNVEKIHGFPRKMIDKWWVSHISLLV